MLCYKKEINVLLFFLQLFVGTIWELSVKQGSIRFFIQKHLDHFRFHPAVLQCRQTKDTFNCYTVDEEYFNN